MGRVNIFHDLMEHFAAANVHLDGLYKTDARRSKNSSRGSEENVSSVGTKNMQGQWIFIIQIHVLKSSH